MEQSGENKKKQRQVEEILMMPIICNKNIKEIVRRENVIYTGQKYCNNADEDMSDFAVDFYEIIYKDIIDCNGILGSKRHFKDRNFSGDTMNSFKTISNKYSGKDFKWPDCLWRYFEGYKCLANFWILPMDIGRTSSRTKPKFRSHTKSKNGINDYMDKFLMDYKEREASYKELFHGYFSKFGDFNNFATRHFLLESYILTGDKINTYSDLQNPDEIVEKMRNNIAVRAKYISDSKLKLKDTNKVLWESLWDYFYNQNLIS